MWILYSVLAAIFWALVNIVDKVTINKLIKKPIIITILLGFVDIVISTIVLLNNFVWVTGEQLLFLVIATLFYIFGTIFYFKAMSKEEASRVVPLFALSLIWVMVFAAVFLNEFFGFQEYFSIIIIFLGSVLISIKRKVRIKISSSFFLMIGSTLLYAASNVIQKHLLENLGFWSIFAYTGIIFFVLLIPVAIYYRQELVLTVKNTRYKGIAALVLISILDSLASLFFLVAMSFGYVTLVEAVTSLQYVFLFLLTIIFSIFLPRVFKEKISKSVVILKLVAIILITVGVILIA